MEGEILKVNPAPECPRPGASWYRKDKVSNLLWCYDLHVVTCWGHHRRQTRSAISGLGNTHAQRLQDLRKLGISSPRPRRQEDGSQQPQQAELRKTIPDNKAFEMAWPKAARRAGRKARIRARPRRRPRLWQRTRSHTWTCNGVHAAANAATAAAGAAANGRAAGGPASADEYAAESCSAASVRGLNAACAERVGKERRARAGW